MCYSDSMRKELLESFLRYVRIDTRSDYESNSFPSTEKQWNLLNLLKDELEAMGLAEVNLDRHGYLTATLEATPGRESVPTIAFIAHVDTSPDVTAENVQPQIIEAYSGGDIELPGNKSEIIYASDNPNLEKCVGDTIVTSDGTTLLGADDKAGIAEIMTAVRHIKNHPEMDHGRIRLAFTPDEEIGKGTDHFDVEGFGADYAYTMDGADLGEIENETFTAAEATIKILGYNVHPGYAKDKRVNAVRIAGHLLSSLPSDMGPATTEGREGYIHPNSVQGNVSEVVIKLIIRDFSIDGVEDKKKMLEDICNRIRQDYPKATVELELKDQYKNMIYRLNEEPRVVEYAMEAVRRTGIEPKLQSIRGGTDGAQLCFKGLLTPNIFAGGQNFHSKREWVSLQWMEKACETIIHLVQIWNESVEERPST